MAQDVRKNGLRPADSDQDELCQSLVAEERCRFLESLSQQRHDWLNHFQVLLGYLKLQKYDLCEEYIKKVTERTNNDSRIAALGYAPLVSYLLTYNALYKEMNLEVEVPEIIQLTSLPELEKHRLYLLVKETVEIYRKSSRDNEGLPNTLMMLIRQVNDAIYISAEFEGRLDDRECLASLRSMVERLGNGEGFFVEGLHNKHESIMEFYFPLSVN